jgi:hypothetical protein
MTEIVWSAAPPEERKEQIDKVLGELKWLLPNWMRTLYVRVDDAGGSDGNWVAAVGTSYQYRTGTLYIYNKWFAETDRDQVKTLIHEFIHAHTAVIVDYAEETFGKMTQDAPIMRDLLNTELGNRSEAATEDLAVAIYDKLYSF